MNEKLETSTGSIYINKYDRFYIIYLIFATVPEKMCMCSAKQSSIYGVNEQSIIKIKEKLPQLLKQREEIQQKQLKEFKNWEVQCLVKKADLIFFNGTIYTMEDSNPIVDAISVTKDRITNVGSEQSIMKWKGPNTRLIDLNGKTLLPGFIDPHIHMVFCSMSNWIQLSPYVYQNADEIYKKIVEVVKNTEEKKWAHFQLFDPMITTGVIDVSRKGLDNISTKSPIFIFQANGHVAHANSLAFEMVGVTKDTPDPPHGRFIRDQYGEFTGQIQQEALQIFTKHIPKLSDVEYEKQFQKFISHASSKGCTMIHDCAIGLGGPETDLYILHKVFKDNAPIRYSGYLSYTKWDSWVKLNMKPEHKDTDLRINGMKFCVDGSTQGGSAFLQQPYLKAIWGVGTANYKQEALNEGVYESQKRGFQVGIHANGDAGIDMALKAYDHVAKKDKKVDLRHRIEHSTVCHKYQLVRMKQLSISPSFLIGHVYYYGAAFRDKILGTKRANLIDPFKSALDCGLVPTIHSDFNCQPIDPLRCIYNAVTRIMKENGQILNQNQCVSPYEAIKAMTISAAWQCHMQDIIGSLKRGKFADFVILEKDPMKVEKTQLKDLKIWQTWKGGFKWYQG